MEARRPLKIVAVSPEPTPYRAPLWDRIAARDDVALLVVYAARTIAGASWSVTPGHPAVVLRGRRFPGAARVLRHDYPITPGVRKVLRRARPDCVVVSGWSTFAAQTALLWCARHGIPYVLLVESHDHDPRAAWRRAVKGAVVPRIVRGAASVLVTGSLAADSMRRRGAPAGRIRVFANTVDVGALHEQAVRLRGRRTELRGLLDLREEDVAVACVGRLVPEKAMDVLLRACAEVGGPLVPVLVGDGPQLGRLQQLAEELGVATRFAGARRWEELVEVYAASDVFALLSRSETWGVVVNEAAACGLPLVLSEHVGAAHDLLVPGENGFRVPVGDVAATAAALARLAGDPALRARYGERSAALASAWGYEPSVEAFVAAVREAAGQGDARALR